MIFSELEGSEQPKGERIMYVLSYCDEKMTVYHIRNTSNDTSESESREIDNFKRFCAKAVNAPNSFES